MDQRVPERESEQFATQVRSMFDGVAKHYDVLNSAMTAGLHHRWRERTVDRVTLDPGDSVLDICCGTGDLALELRDRVGPTGHVVGCDFSEPMLELAREKAAQRQLGDIVFEWADALALPYADASFDAVAVGFGARNLADLDRGLAEMARVLKPGGRLGILEITQPTRPPLSTFYGLWFDRIVPVLGKLSDESAAYSYLPQSVKVFPAPAQLATKIDAAGLEGIRYTILAGGIIAIHSARKP